MRFPETEWQRKYRKDGESFEDKGGDGLKMLLIFLRLLIAHGLFTK